MRLHLRNDFVVFILTHGRPDKVVTYNTLRNNNYTGPIVLVLDNEDTTIGRYKQILRLGGSAEIINISKDIKRIFEMSGIFKIMPLKEEIKFKLILFIKQLYKTSIYLAQNGYSF